MMSNVLTYLKRLFKKTVIYTYCCAYTVLCLYCNDSNNSDHPIIRTPPFPGINYWAFKHPCLKLLFQYLNTYTLQSSNGGHQTSTSLRQPLWSYSESYRTSSSILQVFSNVY